MDSKSKNVKIDGSIKLDILPTRETRRTAQKEAANKSNDKNTRKK